MLCVCVRVCNEGNGIVSKAATWSAGFRSLVGIVAPGNGQVLDDTSILELLDCRLASNLLTSSRAATLAEIRIGQASPRLTC